MMLIKQLERDYELSTSWLWQRDESDDIVEVFDAPTKTHLCFGIFLLDRFTTSGTDQINLLFNSVDRKFANWRERYPWTEYSGVKLRIEEMNDSVPYIFGQLCTEDNTQEENSLITGILQELSQGFRPEIFIKICDTEGDFILAECNEFIPKDYEYPIANNRLWLHEGKFKMIPNYFYPDRGLMVSETLEFLTKAYYKLQTLTDLSSKINEKYIKNFPESNLQDLKKLKVNFEDSKSFELIKKNPTVASFLLKQLLREPVEISSHIDEKSNTNQLELLIPLSHINLLSLHLDSQNLKTNEHDLEIYTGRIMSSLLKKFLDDDTLITSENHIVYPHFNIQSDIFKDYRFENISILRPVEVKKDVEPNDELMDMLGTFLNQSTTTKMDEDRDNISGESKTEDDPDRQVLDFFKSQNVNINEDDFFEFFLKEALKMPDDKVEEMAQEFTDGTNLSKNTTHNEDTWEELDDILEEQDLKENPTVALKELFESLNVDGSSEGPFQTMLRHLSQQNK